MPIISIITQPATDSLNAAYRPISFVVRATRTDASAQPPVVYCDVYIGGVFYKSIPKTQYLLLHSTNSDWYFDIQDPLQEVLNKYIADNGGVNMIQTTNIAVEAYCKFRSSGFDSDGFVQYENTQPIQASGTQAAVAGTGTQSNTFNVVNTVLQHDQNQDLSAHLSYYKTRVWASGVLPLSHRTDAYRICKNDSDFFGIISTQTPDCIVVKYRYNKADGYSTSPCRGVVQGSGGGGGDCVPVSIVTDVLPNGIAAVEYDQYIQLSGTAPFTLTDIIKPFWMTIVAIVGNTVHINGTPANDEAGNYSLSFTVHNCTSDIAEFAAGFTIVAVGATIGVCVAAHDETVGSRIFIGVNSTEVVTVNTLCHCIIHTSWDGGTGFTNYPFDRTLRAGYTSSVHAKLLYDGTHVDEIFIGAEITSFVPATQAGKTFTYIGLCT